MYDYMYIYRKILKLTLLYDIQPERKMKKQSQIFVTVVALLICHNVMVSQKRCYTYDAAGCRVLRDQSCDPACSIIVSNTNDSGTGSLRKAIECAQHGDTIKFASNVIGQTISLTSGPIQINKNIHIIQQSSSEVSISSNLPTLSINSGSCVFQHIQIYAGCQINCYGTGIINYGDIILRDVTIIQDPDPNCGAASVYNLGGMIIEGTTKIIKQ